MAGPLLAQLVGGDFLFAFISAVSFFATILAVVSGIVVTGATAFSHDFYNEILKDGKATQKQQMFMVRASSIVITVISIGLSLSLQSFNVTFLAVLALTLAASSNLPVILLTIFWKKFNKTGAVTGMLVGLISTIGLIALSPNVWNPVPGCGFIYGRTYFSTCITRYRFCPIRFLSLLYRYLNRCT